MSYPNYYPSPINDGKLVPADWNAMVDFHDGFTPAGTFVNPANFTISTDGTDTYASNAFQVVYGGPDDDGAVDGGNAAAVLQAAINALAATGGKIGVAKGNYTLTAAIQMSDYVDLICSKSSLFALGFNGNLFEFKGDNDAALLGASLYGDRTHFTGHAILLEDAGGVGSCRNTIMNNRILSFGTRGISVEDATSVHNNIINNYIEDVLSEGIMLSRCNYNKVQGNSVVNTGLHGIVSTGGSYNNITGNEVENAGGNYVAGFAHGIAVDGNGGANPCYGNIVSGNTIKTAYMAGIEVADAAHATTINGNYVADSGDYGIYFGGSLALSYNGTISGNVVYLCGTNGDQGILVSGVDATHRTWKVAITGNCVDAALGDGIQLKWVDDSVISGNSCELNGGYGIAFANADSDYNVIVGNNCRQNVSGGINLNGANGNGIKEHNLEA